MGHHLKFILMTGLAVLVGVVFGYALWLDLRVASPDPCREPDGSVVYYDLKMRGKDNVEVMRMVQCQCVGEQFMGTIGAMCVERHQWKKK